MQGKLVIFSAPSGSGKTTLVNHLLSKNLNLEFSVSATSRQPRLNEVHGKDYYFISKEEFLKKINNNEFLEWEEVYGGTLYGTLKSEVERIRSNGKHVIFDVDVVGGINIKNFYGKDALAVFVKPPSLKELRSRLENRSTESQEKIKMRMDKAEKELQFENQFDAVILNKKLKEAMKIAETIVSDFLAGKIESSLPA